MLESLFGSKTAERVFLYLANYGQGYAREIALTFETTLSMVQKQLAKGETAGSSEDPRPSALTSPITLGL